MKDFSNLNHLPTETKVLIANGQALVEEAKETIKDRDLYLDMTSKMLLKSGCKEVEKYIKLITNGKINEKNQKALELATVKLRTSIDGLVEFYTR